MPGGVAWAAVGAAALLVAVTSACGASDPSVTAAPGSTSSSSSSSSSPSAPSPTSAPTGGLTAAECPEARSSGIADYVDDSGGEPWQQAVARYVRQKLSDQHPHAVPSITARTQDDMEVTFVDGGGSRVALLHLEHVPTGWRIVTDEMCSTMAHPETVRHY